MLTRKMLSLLFCFFTFFIVLIKRVYLQLETVKSILKQMQCRILFNKKAKNDKRRVLGPCVTFMPQYQQHHHRIKIKANSHTPV